MNTSDFLDVLCEALLREPGTISLDDTPDTIEEWDSIGHLSIIAAVDSELSVPIETEEMQTFSSIRQLVDVLKGAGALED